MKKQKICIVGGGLTGLVTAIGLSKLNCEIDIIINNTYKNARSYRTVAVSENNFDFINKLNISESLKKEMWPSSDMKLYTEVTSGKFSEIFDFKSHNKKKRILYVIENSKIIKLMMYKIKKIKSITIKKYSKIFKIDNSGLMAKVKVDNNYNKYNLIILCTGSNSSLVKEHFQDQKIENSYKELSITTIIKHHLIKNNTARQLFLDNEILALLPISHNKTSVVWSVKKNTTKTKDLAFIKNKIKFYAENFLKNIKFDSKIEHKDLNFLIRNKYYQNRVLLFGDALHVIHPFVGQGFNMTIRDLKSLIKILSKKINLGLDIGGSDILSEFSNEIKPRNFGFSFGTDLLKNLFSYKNFRNQTLKVLNKNNFAKNIFFNIADKGFKF